MFTPLPIFNHFQHPQRTLLSKNKRDYHFKRGKKPPVLGGKDMQSPCMYDMIRVHYENLVTVNDSYGSPHTLYGMWEPCNCQ